MSKTRTAWIVYTVLRLLFFAVPFGILLVIGLQPWLAAIFAALIGMALSVLLLAKQRSVASESIYDWRNRDRTADDIVEDEAVEAAAAPEQTAPAEPTASPEQTAPAEPIQAPAAAEAPEQGDRA